MNTNILKFSSILAGIAIGICLLWIVMPQVSNADFSNIRTASYAAKNANKAVQTIKVVVTAYSSTPEQTDDTPFITASGKSVADGIIANNMLPFGTRVRIPSLYGNKVFTVEDRMAWYKSKYHIDIWMPSYDQAKNFGVKTVDLEVLES